MCAIYIYIHVARILRDPNLHAPQMCERETPPRVILCCQHNLPNYLRKFMKRELMCSALDSCVCVRAYAVRMCVYCCFCMCYREDMKRTRAVSPHHTAHTYTLISHGGKICAHTTPHTVDILQNNQHRNCFKKNYKSCEPPHVLILIHYKLYVL